jgi:hypothetical protein
MPKERRSLSNETGSVELPGGLHAHVVRTAVNIKLTRLTRGPTWIQGVVSWLPVVAIPGSHAAYAVAVDLTGTLYTPRADGAVSVEAARPSGYTKQKARQGD